MVINSFQKWRLTWAKQAFVACLLVVIVSPAFGQSIAIERESKATLILGQISRWTIVVKAQKEKPLLGRLPAISGGSLLQSQDEMRVDSATGLWAAKWQIDLRGKRVGRIELPPIAIHIGSETEQTEATFVDFVKDEKGGEFSFLEWRPVRDFFWQGEVVEVEARFGFDLRFFAENVLQPFRRPLDIPVKITAPWLTNEGQARVLSNELDVAPVGVELLRSLVVNDELTRWSTQGEEVRNDRKYGVVSWVFRRVGMPSGTTKLPLSLARFFFAEEFEEDFFQEKVAKQKFEGFVYADQNQIRVRDLPEVGRPDGFTGAVGAFTVQASISSSLAQVNDSIEYVMTIRGAGDPSLIKAPAWTPTPGFRVQGVISRFTDHSIQFEYNLLVLSPGERTISPVKFAYFDPRGAGAYAVAATPALTLMVEGDGPMPARDSMGLKAGVNDIIGFDAGVEVSAPRVGVATRPWFYLILWFLPWVMGGVFLRFILIRDRESRDPAWARSRRAMGRFRVQLRTDNHDVGPIFATYLAAKMGVPESQVYGPSLVQDLLDARSNESSAHQANDVFQRLTNSRFGGPVGRVDREELIRLASTLEQQLKQGSMS
ncbi:MAG: hypothetical protein ACI97A_003960 [Planctomycetota bacterium]